MLAGGGWDLYGTALAHVLLAGWELYYYIPRLLYNISKRKTYIEPMIDNLPVDRHRDPLHKIYSSRS